MKKTIIFVLILAVLSTLFGCEMFTGPSEAESVPTEQSAQESDPATPWPSDNPLLANVPAFSVGRITEITENDGVLRITVENIDAEEFRMYVSSLKANGFNDTVFESETLFSAFSKVSEVELLGISVRFTEEAGKIEFDISKTDAIQESSEPEESTDATESEPAESEAE